MNHSPSDASDFGGSSFDLIGDVHGCLAELLALLTKLGYATSGQKNHELIVQAPAGRRAVFLGDLVNRGPEVAGVLRLVMGMVADGQAYCVRGNHDAYLLRHLQGGNVAEEFGPDYGAAVATSMSQLDMEDAAFRADVAAFLAGLPAYLLLDGSRLAAAHAGLLEEYQSNPSEAGREFAVFGYVSDKKASRPAWPGDYAGQTLVAYGHYAEDTVRWSNNAVCLDTGCVYGERLTALRYPEREIVSVPAERVYYESRKFRERLKRPRG